MNHYQQLHSLSHAVIDALVASDLISPEISREVYHASELDVSFRSNSMKLTYVHNNVRKSLELQLLDKEPSERMEPPLKRKPIQTGAGWTFQHQSSGLPPEIRVPGWAQPSSEDSAFWQLAENRPPAAAAATQGTGWHVDLEKWLRDTTLPPTQQATVRNVLRHVPAATQELVRWFSWTAQERAVMGSVLWFFTLLQLEDQILSEYLDPFLREFYRSVSSQPEDVIQPVIGALNVEYLQLSCAGFSKTLGNWWLSVDGESEQLRRDTTRVCGFAQALLYGCLPGQTLPLRSLGNLETKMLSELQEVWKKVLNANEPTPKQLLKDQLQSEFEGLTEAALEGLESEVAPRVNEFVLRLHLTKPGTWCLLARLRSVARAAQVPFGAVAYYLMLIGDREAATSLQVLVTSAYHLGIHERHTLHELERTFPGLELYVDDAIEEHSQFTYFPTGVLLLLDALAFKLLPYQQEQLLMESGNDAYRHQVHDVMAELLVPVLQASQTPASA